MNQEEIKKLAIECGAIINESEESRTDDSCDHVIFFLDELAAYTAEVEAREREVCALLVENRGIATKTGEWHGNRHAAGAFAECIRRRPNALKMEELK